MTTKLAVTPAQIEGPYWLPGSPPRANLVEPGIPGDRIVLSGSVRTAKGTPVEGAWVDVWQCDGEGVYDVQGYKLRGHQFTDAAGRYRVETVVPVDYEESGERDGEAYHFTRTPHIHVKVKAPRRETLTTQLYFPDQPLNQTDSIFVADCIVEMSGSGKEARFDFVLA
jgi:protocatechuate 3,4-dioxygenase beta subunit